LAHLSVRWEGASIAIDGQSNHHDATFAILSTRSFLSTFGVVARAVERVLPADTRHAMGSTAFENTVIRTTTGRSLGSPFMTACEQTAIGVLAAAFAAESPIIEVGSAIGGSTLLMAAATDAGERSGPEIWSVDPDAPTRHVMRALFEVEGYSTRLRQIVKTSDEAVGELASVRGKAGLVFIDGLHTEAAVASDFANYAEFVRPGGCIAFHDVDARFAGIFRVVAERVVTDGRFRPLFMVDTIAAFERIG
jgi:predicted O-methyltransferase YrrM